VADVTPSAAPEPSGPSSPSSPSSPSAPRRASAIFRCALAVFVVEAALVWLYVGFLGYADLTRPVGDSRRAALVTIYFAGCGLAFAAVGWGLYRRRSWARAPAIVLQLLLAALGYVMVSAGVPAVGVPVLVAALLGAVLLLTPAAREALTAKR
jgi:hypothetical protein